MSEPASLAVADLDPTDIYKLMTGLVVPRPIGWVGTVDREGRTNVAPYSFFQAVATNPPTVLFSVGVTDGFEKDSLRNCRETGEFTCNLVDMTIYVTNKQLYLDRVKEVGAAWREVMGKNFPAMALVQVAGLLEKGALVEVKATAALP